MSQAATLNHALKKLKDQLTCAICLDAFKDPKLLQCFHVYCKDCLQRLVVQDRQGQLSLRCPTCRQSTLLPPATSVSGLQPAFHIRHLFEIQEALEMMKQTEKVQCEKCTKISQTATNSCRDCIYLQQVSPEQCYAIGKGVEIAKLGERATAVLHLVNIKRKVCTTPVATPTCELVSTITHLLI